MASTSQQFTSPGSPHDAPAQDATARWMEEQDFLLGCESADPMLQIERWGQEVALGAAAGT